MNSLGRYFFSACCILLASSVPAHAYLDPGTGSVLIQGAIAAIAAVGFTINLYWYRIKNYISRKKDKRPPDGESGEQ